MKEGTRRVPSLFRLKLFMDKKAQIKDFVQKQLAHTALFEVDTTISADGKRITIILDGDELIKIEDCSAISRALETFIEENMLAPADYNLTVSSPGADKPFKLLRQIPKHVGRTLKITTNEKSTVQGKLMAVVNSALVLEVGIKEKGKKLQILNQEIPFDSVKEAKVVLDFN